MYLETEASGVVGPAVTIASSWGATYSEYVRGRRRRPIDEEAREHRDQHQVEPGQRLDVREGCVRRVEHPPPREAQDVPGRIRRVAPMLLLRVERGDARDGAAGEHEQDEAQGRRQRGEDCRRRRLPESLREPMGANEQERFPGQGDGEQDTLRPREPGEQRGHGGGLVPSRPDAVDRCERDGQEDGLGEGREEEERRREDGQVEDGAVGGAAIEVGADHGMQDRHGGDEADGADGERGDREVPAEERAHGSDRERVEREEGGRRLARLIAVLRDSQVPAGVPSLPHAEETALEPVGVEHRHRRPVDHAVVEAGWRELEHERGRQREDRQADPHQQEQEQRLTEGNGHPRSQVSEPEPIHHASG